MMFILITLIPIYGIIIHIKRQFLIIEIKCNIKTISCRILHIRSKVIFVQMSFLKLNVVITIEGSHHLLLLVLFYFPFLLFFHLHVPLSVHFAFPAYLWWLLLLVQPDTFGSLFQGNQLKKNYRLSLYHERKQNKKFKKLQERALW